MRKPHFLKTQACNYNLQISLIFFRFYSVQTYLEVKSDISTLHLNPEATVNLTRVEKGSHWDSKPDHTTMMVQDWGVITTYNKFLKDWVQITRHMYEEFCKEYRSNHRCYAHLNKTSSVR